MGGDEDAEREQVLIELGLLIVRFGNEEVMKNLSAVVGKIRRRIYIMNHPDN